MIENYLREKLNLYLQHDISAVVLGCTHYPFIRNELFNIIKEVPIIDGSIGTVRELKRKLIINKILNDKKEAGNIEILNSLQNSEIIKLSHKLLNI